MGLLTRFAETYNYSYSDSFGDGATSNTNTLDPGVFVTLMIFAVIFVIGIYVVTSIFMAKIFKKAGVEGWKAWVPFYNQWVFFELGGQKGWLSLLSLLGAIPFIGWIGSIVALVFAIIAAHNIGKSLGKESWFVLLYFFLSLVWIIWLAIDDSTWKPIGADQLAQPAFQPPAAPQSAPFNPPTDQTPPTPPVNPLVQ